MICLIHLTHCNNEYIGTHLSYLNDSLDGHKVLGSKFLSFNTLEILLCFPASSVAIEIPMSI